MMIGQTENYWSYLRGVVIPARWNSGKRWLGSIHQVMTNRPGSPGTTRVSGGSGMLAGAITESIESLSAAAYCASIRPVSMSGDLPIAIP